MDNTKLNCSMNDTTELKKLILENPDFPLLIFCGEEAWSGEYPYEQADARCRGVEELTLYDNYWVDRDDYEKRLSDDLCDQPEYKGLSDEEYGRMIAKKVQETQFVKAIVIHVG